MSFKTFHKSFRFVYTVDNLRIFILSLLITISIHSGLWKASQNRYPDDSLFTLSFSEISGLLMLASIMAMTLFLISLSKTYWLYHRTEHFAHSIYKYTSLLIFDLLMTVALCLLSFFLAPQFYYLYYQQIIEGLPNQWVVGGGLSLERIFYFFTLPADGSIADHATGVILWVCMLSSALYPLLKAKPLSFKYLLWMALLLISLQILLSL